jgi:transglutaminase-like putative cysteine protease
MVYRYSWIAGTAAIALAFWELSSLLRPSTSGTPWQIAILVATLLGAGITWTAIAYRARAIVVIGANIVGFILTVGLLVAPNTLWLILPTRSTVNVVWSELSRALELIRYGVEPVRPLPGLVMLIGVLFWTLGFLLVAGLLNNRPFVAVLTPLIVALQFVIIDRRPESIVELAIFVGVVAMALLAIRLDERDGGSGRLQRVDATSKPSSRPSLAITLLVVATVAIAVSAVAATGDRIPTDGYVSWRTPAGFSDEYSGSVAYNPYTSIRSGLNTATNNPVFRAEIEGADPSTVRFRTVTLDLYRNGRWSTDRVQIFPIDEEPWIDPDQAYQGETVEVTTSIRIDNLAQPWMPAPDTPNAVIAESEDDQKSIRVRKLDGSLILPGDRTYDGMTYAIRSDLPRYDGSTIAALARTADGELSPMFTAAVADGQEVPSSAPPPSDRELANEEFWLEYPLDELGGRAFERYAEDIVDNLDTNFEKAIALESWFRDTNRFTYNSRVPSENTTSDVLAWLTDEDNPYVRNGYCEQFATAMALLARAVDVPSRVVLGFTPGTALNDTTVQVYDKNAHSWVELWIPNFGWMAFDPTPRSGYSAPTADDSLELALGFSPADYVDDIPNPTFVDTEGGGIGPDGRFQPNPERDNPFVGSGGGSDSANSGMNLPSWLPVALASTAILIVLLVAAPFVKWARRRRYAKRLESGDVSAAWEDIVDRLIDLREIIDPASTPLETALSIDPSFEALATTYGASLYGEASSTTAVIDQATNARLRAEQHLTTRYSRGERLVAAYRPSRLLARWRGFTRRWSRR